MRVRELMRILSRINPDRQIDTITITGDNMNMTFADKDDDWLQVK